ncbi:MAG: hypothetical protein WCW61_02590 [Patescibacteria group bacterium]|jgi:hypothetical protein
MNDLSHIEAKAMAQSENIAGIKNSINRELKKENPNPQKLENLKKTLRLTENAFSRTQLMV